ncbi:MAG: ATP-dependent Clp protease ATP-binding subunit ClpA [Deltaproteobacteria bacterium]|nr:ATP-dependent Clp protease ATP-binding subunit ClpA [Deltaproteobacteria bacterium]
MISKELQNTLNFAYTEAKKRRHDYLTLEHLLYALLQDWAIIKIVHACGGSVQKLLKELERFFDDQLITAAGEGESEIHTSLAVQRVLQRAFFHVQASGKSEVTAANVLVALFSEKDSHAVYFLSKQGIHRLDVVSYISHGISKLPGADGGDPEFGAPLGEEMDEEGGTSGGGDTLERFAVNLNQKAREGKIDPLIGREHELERTIHVLCRRRKNNPLYVGEAGVGKTAIAEGLALKIYNKDVPELLEDAVVYSLDLGALLAGTKFRGDFEQRLKGVLARLKKEPGAILFIDEIHTLIGAGATTGGTMDASNLLKPVLASGDLKCIGSTTYQEYKAFEKDRALSRRFQKIDVPEPSVEETIKILKGLKSRFEEHHQVHYTQSALVAAAQLSAKYLNDRHLPDKAIDVIDEVGAALRLRPKSQQKKTVTAQDVEGMIAKMARIPSKAVSLSDKETLRHLDRELKQRVFGQDKAIDQLASAIKLSRSGLGPAEKPIGSFLFCGPTGVGKTELSKELARTLGIQFLRFDMSEYMEKHTVSRLIGAPPGYVGFDQGGLLTDAINQKPHAVLLLDEIEKAHPDLFNILLQVMDYGTLTDNNGKKADFRNIILIMTTNAGARDLAKKSIGIGNTAGSQGHDMKAIKDLFSPEFLNRLDTIVPFVHLDTPTVMHVVEKFLAELEMQLLEKKVELEVSIEAKTWLAKNGYDEKYGARPLSRLIQEKIKRALADEILFGRLEKGGSVSVGVENDELSFQYSTGPAQAETTEMELN